MHDASQTPFLVNFLNTIIKHFSLQDDEDLISVVRYDDELWDTFPRLINRQTRSTEKTKPLTQENEHSIYGLLQMLENEKGKGFKRDEKMVNSSENEASNILIFSIFRSLALHK